MRFRRCFSVLISTQLPRTFQGDLTTLFHNGFGVSAVEESRFGHPARVIEEVVPDSLWGSGRPAAARPAAAASCSRALRRRPARPRPLRGRRLAYSSAQRGAARRPVAGRQRPSRLQAPPDRRRLGYPAGAHRDLRPPRRHPAPAPARRGPTDPRDCAGDHGASRELFADRGYALRLRHLPPATARAWHHPTLARRGTAHGSGRSKVRWVVKRTFTPSSGCMLPGGCASAGNAVMTSTSVCSSSRAPSSASVSSTRRYEKTC